MDKNGIVLYVGTFSKILFPGLRVGWIAAPVECVRRIGKLREATSICGNILSEAAIDEFCRRGYYEHHLIKANREFKRRMKIALETMEKEIRKGIHCLSLALKELYLN
jgi:DNA-binding transcriptional MocR family regulator